MRKFIYAVVIMVVVVVELFIAAQPLLTGNPARVPYRRQERAEALTAMSENRSPETEARFREEMRLAENYERKQKLRGCALILAAFLLFDVLCIYSYWRTRHQNKTGC